MQKEWFAVMTTLEGEEAVNGIKTAVTVSELNTFYTGAVCDGWFCDEELARKLYEQRKTDKRYSEVILVKVLSTKKPFGR